MAIIMQVGKPIDANRVEVNATYNNGVKQNFSVEKEKADTFAASYKESLKKSNLILNLTWLLSGGLGGILGGQLAKNITGWKKWGAIVVGAIATSTIVSSIVLKPLENKQQKILDSFGAKIIPPTDQKSETKLS